MNQKIMRIHKTRLGLLFLKPLMLAPIPSSSDSDFVRISRIESVTQHSRLNISIIHGSAIIGGSLLSLILSGF